MSDGAAVSWKDILQIGDPRLREPAEVVADPTDPAAAADGAKVHAALLSFRKANGRGRGTAATQLGINRRIVALNMPSWPELLYNPRITWKSDEKFTLWEGCMSFPFLLAKVARSASITVEFQDGQGEIHCRENLDRELAELLQHEFDHLDGVLSVDHAIDRDSLLAREVFNANRAYYLAQVDYAGNHEALP